MSKMSFFARVCLTIFVNTRGPCGSIIEDVCCSLHYTICDHQQSMGLTRDLLPLRLFGLPFGLRQIIVFEATFKSGFNWMKTGSLNPLRMIPVNHTSMAQVVQTQPFSTCTCTCTCTQIFDAENCSYSRIATHQFHYFKKLLKGYTLSDRTHIIPPKGKLIYFLCLSPNQCL
jgi:hypothetical protein